MRPLRDRSAYLDRVVVLFLLALFVLVSPLNGFWASMDAPWYGPYLLWAAMIALSFWLQRRRYRDEI